MNMSNSQHEKYKSCLYNARHLQKRLYDCLNCQAHFSVPIQLAHHIALHHNSTTQKQKSYRCKFRGCAKRFRSNKRRVQHQALTHKNELSDLLPPLLKTKTISIKKNVIKKTNHALKCPFCFKVFMSSYGLLEHVKKII